MLVWLVEVGDADPFSIGNTPSGLILIFTPELANVLVKLTCEVVLHVKVG